MALILLVLFLLGAIVYLLWALVKSQEPLSTAPYGAFVPYTLPDRLPEPWRGTERGERAVILPPQLLLVFARAEEMREIEHKEVDKQRELQESLFTEGLKEPLTIVVDRDGKVRFHDGHHRLTIIRENLDKFPGVPVIIERAERIRGYGRSMNDEAETILRMFSHIP